MLSQWSLTVTARLLAYATVARARVRNERGALNTTEFLGLIIIVLGILAVVGVAVKDYVGDLVSTILHYK